MQLGEATFVQRLSHHAIGTLERRISGTLLVNLMLVVMADSAQYRMKPKSTVSSR